MGVFVESQEILLRRASAAHGAGIPRIENSVKDVAESKNPQLSLQHLRLCFSCWLDKHTLQISKYFSCCDHSGA